MFHNDGSTLSGSTNMVECPTPPRAARTHAHVPKLDSTHELSFWMWLALAPSWFLPPS